MECGSARDLNLRPRRSKATRVTTIPRRLHLGGGHLTQRYDRSVEEDCTDEQTYVRVLYYGCSSSTSNRQTVSRTDRPTLARVTRQF